VSWGSQCQRSDDRSEPEGIPQELAVRETIRSLRIYLVFSGVVGTIANLNGLVPGASSWVGVLFAIAGATASAGLLYTGLRLPHLLRHQPAQALAIVYFNMGVASVALLAVLAFGGTGVGIAQLAFGLLVLWYIHINMKRLAASEASPTEALAAG
jgi:hypothetical protein